MGASFPPGSFAQAFIAAMITPALLILASGSLIATALARLGRIMDRIRTLADAASGAVVPAVELDRQMRRARYAGRAITTLFAAVTLFVTAGIAIAADRLAGGRLEWLPILLTLIGMLLIVAAGGALAAESRLAAQQIEDDIARMRGERGKI